MEVDRRVHREFPDWFQRRIINDNLRDSYSPDLVSLAVGPREWATRFTRYNVNGFKFRTLSRDHGHCTQHSGVFGTFGTRSYSSSRDGVVQYAGVAYYGRIVDIIQLDYHGRFQKTLFKCEWVNTTTQRGLKKDNLGITSVNFARLFHTGQTPDDEPYILASQAQQVYYVADPKHKGWNMVVHLKPRDLYDMGEGDNVVYDNDPFDNTNFDNFLPEGDDDLPAVRYTSSSLWFTWIEKF